jgi:hypothetical protein
MELEHSKYSSWLSHSGIAVAVDIYRRTSDQRWTLEVTNAAGVSMVWESHFATDQGAWDEFYRIIADESMGIFAPFAPTVSIN